MDVSCHRPFLPGTSLEPAVIPTAQASSFTLQYFPYYVRYSKYIIIIIIIIINLYQTHSHILNTGFEVLK